MERNYAKANIEKDEDVLTPMPHPKGGCAICDKCGWHIIQKQCGCGSGMSKELKDLLEKG